MTIDPYHLLGVDRSVSQDDIKRAFHRLAQRLHPDANSGSPGARVQFQDLAAAYDVLSSADRRQKFDSLPSGEAQQHFTMRVTPSRRIIAPLAEPQLIYLLVEISSPPRTRQLNGKAGQSRLNLTLVLDRSRSMNGPRMERVKYAAQKIVDNLSDDDILSVVSFSDRASVIVPAAPVSDRAALKARISMIHSAGGTEIFQGLSEGAEQNRRYAGPQLVNHIILLTDGHTFGDQDRCLSLAQDLSAEGISISAMGLGQDWNDVFLDSLATATGGTSTFIRTPDSVAAFMNEQVRSLSMAFAERVQLSVASDPDVTFETAFKLSPQPQPLATDVERIPLGVLHDSGSISVLLQFQLPPIVSTGFRTIARLVSTGDILQNDPQAYLTVCDMSLEISSHPSEAEPSPVIVDALGKLALYRLQESAQSALESGNVVEATRRLENLATRLLEMGEGSLAQQTLMEARRVSRTSQLSETGRKTLKYQTRALLEPDSLQSLLSSILSSNDENDS